jgi:hypothetical protein
LLTKLIDHENRNHGSSSTVLRVNSFLLSMCSPVLHKMLCGSFIESSGRKLALKDVDGTSFGRALDMWCGKKTEIGLDDARELASLADRLQMTELVSALDERVMEHLQEQITAGRDVLGLLDWCGELGLSQSEKAARKLATERFEELAKTDDFIRMGEDALAALLDDDDLVVRSEEAVWEAVVGWRRAQDDGQARGRGLVGKIRFPLMEEGYLRSRVVGMAPAEEKQWMEGVVAEALRAKAAREDGEGCEFDLLGPKALDDRVGLGVDWKRYADGGEQRLKGHLGEVTAFTECEGLVCSGSLDGSILVWSMTGEAADEPERRLVPEGPRDEVQSLAAWKGRLISGHDSGQLRVWNVVTGACDQVLEGHTRAVLALVVCGSRLASGSHDCSIKVWAMKAAAPWACERTLLGHTSWVRSLAAWQGKVLSGSDDRSIRVWVIGTGAHVATLLGHTNYVLALAVHRDRLFSGSRDATIRMWALGTWAALRTIDIYRHGMWGRPVCLSLCGAHLVCGSGGWASTDCPGSLRVWGLDTLDLQQQLLQPAGGATVSVRALLSVTGMIWAGVGRDVAVWGRGL